MKITIINHFKTKIFANIFVYVKYFLYFCKKLTKPCELYFPARLFYQQQIEHPSQAKNGFLRLCQF